MKLAPDGWLTPCRRVESPNQDERPPGGAITLLVVHSISLPPGEYGGDGIERLFTNRLDPAAHPYFRDIADLEVSAHFLIRRDGELLQFVATTRRAWHAGISTWRGRERCNDFSIGVELEGSDDGPFEPQQYEQLAALINALREHHPLRDIAAHSDIAPGRKTDPGPGFDWPRLLAALSPFRTAPDH
jgi:AmpD protein